MRSLSQKFGVLVCGVLGYTGSVQAEEKGFEVQELRLGVGAAAERWQEPALMSVYGKNGKVLPNVSLSYRFHKHISLDVQAGMGRLSTENDRNVFQMLPVTVGTSLLFGNKDIEPFIGVGAGFVQFSEQLLPYIESTSAETVYGTKLGVDTKAGFRIGTRMIQTTQHPTAPQGFSQMDVEIMMGYRVHQAFQIGTGLNMNAFRFGVGLNFRL